MFSSLQYVSSTLPSSSLPHLHLLISTKAHALSKQIHDHYLPKLISHDPNNITSQHEITVRNRLFNVDGFGAAWYTSARADFNEGTGKRPAVYKTSQPPTNDPNFHSICANTATTACFAHIRAATATAVTPVNNHPFTFGRHTIMHNGEIADFIKIKKQLAELIDDEVYASLQGSTDSEHLAALYMTFLIKYNKQAGSEPASKSSAGPRASWELQYPATTMADALRDVFITIIALQHRILDINTVEANSLNVAVTDGEQLVAFRFRNHQIEQPPSLYYSTHAGVTLNRKYPDHPNGIENRQAFKKAEEHGKHIIVASEPTTYKQAEWDLIPKNHGVVVDVKGNMKIIPIEVEDILLTSAKTTRHS